MVEDAVEAMEVDQEVKQVIHCFIRITHEIISISRHNNCRIQLASHRTHHGSH